MLPPTPNAWRNPRLANRLPELDGVRGLAILLVLVWHYVISAVAVEPFSWQAYALVPFRLMWTGVDLFFVLSGFLIGGILYDAKGTDTYYRTFYLRRIHRITPLYLVWVALFVVGLYLSRFTKNDHLHAIFNSEVPAWSYLLFLQNFFMSSHKAFGPQWMGITWSLAIEEQFYLLLPLFIRRFRFKGIACLALTSIILAPVFRTVLSIHGNPLIGPYVLLPARADALGFGVLVALACRSEAAWQWLASHRGLLFRVFILLGSGVVYLTLKPAGLYTVGLTWIAGFYATGLTLVVVNPGSVESAFFRGRALVQLGTLAYGVYLIHQGINYLFHYALLGAEPSINNWPALSVTVLSLIVVMLVSSLSWRLYERPLIRRAHSRYRYRTNSERDQAETPAVAQALGFQ